MKPRSVALLLLVAVATCLCSLVGSQNVPVQGDEPYTPSKLEWLALELNATSRWDFTPDHPASLVFVAQHGKNTILLYVQFDPDAKSGVVHTMIESAKEVVKIRANKLGWDGWVLVEVATKELKRR